MNTETRFFTLYADLLQLAIRDNEAWIEVWSDIDGWDTLYVSQDDLQAIIDEQKLPLTVSGPLGWGRWVTSTKVNEERL